MLKYHQNSSNSFCLSSLVSAFHSIFDNRNENAFANRIKESLTLQTDIFMDGIDFSNDIMKKHLRHKGEQSLIYNLKR